MNTYQLIIKNYVLKINNIFSAKDDADAIDQVKRHLALMENRFKLTYPIKFQITDYEILSLDDVNKCSVSRTVFEN